MITLNEDQQRALDEILTARARGGTRHLLTGYAGSGKTTLMQEVVRHLEERGDKVAITAPTHKAAAVLTRKLREAGITATAATIHSLLGLRPAPTDSERSILKRSGPPQTRLIDAVIIDECSMISADLQDFIDEDLADCFVLYVGDPAQLPPVGEREARCFSTPSRSRLNTVVRQAAGNPVLQAATAIRNTQGGTVDWGWAQTVDAAPLGVYLGGSDCADWLKDAFTSDEFRADNDAFRYVAYTNAKVAWVNRMVRRWIYGETLTPFVAGERVICRTPISKLDGEPALSTNEEGVVESIQPSSVRLDFAALPDDDRTRRAVPGWTASIPTWLVKLSSDSGEEGVCDIPQEPAALDRVLARLKTEAGINRGRWFERFKAAERFSRLQSPYAMTVHTSQGSTFQNVFVDVQDIRKLEYSDPLQMQQMLYVAVTRASHAVVLVGADSH